MAGDPAARSRSRPTGPIRSKIRVDVPRLAALDVLKAVRVDDAYANLVLPAVIRHYNLEARDAAFTTELASGTIRQRGLYDAVLAACVDRKLSKVEDKVLDALRLGAHQILSMRVPSHAAISTTVDLVGYKATTGAASFTNAVLRRVDERDLETWIAQVAPDPQSNLEAYAQIAFSHPAWVVDELRRAVGPEELIALLAADNLAPGVTLVARPGVSTREELGGELTTYSPYGVHLESGNPGAVPAVADGRAGVQDEGSQLVAHLLLQAEVVGRDEQWLDLCAGPGGKAALLAAVAHQRGAQLTALEPQPHRAKLVERALAAGPGNATVVTGDGTAPPFASGSFDRILVDAPCTGLGALRRRPEARWRRKADDLLPLVLLQRKLLDTALDLVRPGGVVVYSTCSPVLSETGDVVRSILHSHPDVELEDAAALLPQIPRIEAELPGTVQLWPHRHGTDAMFMALLRRKA